MGLRDKKLSLSTTFIRMANFLFILLKGLFLNQNTQPSRVLPKMISSVRMCGTKYIMYFNHRPQALPRRVPKTAANEKTTAVAGKKSLRKNDNPILKTIYRPKATYPVASIMPIWIISSCSFQLTAYIFENAKIPNTNPVAISPKTIAELIFLKKT
jgi:hypothetical protein